jgi:hypothetical protein
MGCATGLRPPDPCSGCGPRLGHTPRSQQRLDPQSFPLLHQDPGRDFLVEPLKCPESLHWPACTQQGSCPGDTPCLLTGRRNPAGGKRTLGFLRSCSGERFAVGVERCGQGRTLRKARVIVCARDPVSGQCCDYSCTGLAPTGWEEFTSLEECSSPT